MTALKSSWICILTFSQSNCTELFETQFGHNLQTIIIVGLYFNPIKRIDKKSILFKDLIEQGANNSTDIHMTGMNCLVT